MLKTRRASTADYRGGRKDIILDSIGYISFNIVACLVRYRAYSKAGKFLVVDLLGSSRRVKSS